MKDRIKQIRNSKEWNQSKFAEDLGVSISNIQSYETGRRIPSDAFVKLICSKYSISETWLRTGEGDMFLPMTKEQELAHLTKKIFNEEIPIEVSALIKVLSEMTDEEFAMFTRFVNKYMTRLEEEKENLPE